MRSLLAAMLLWAAAGDTAAAATLDYRVEEIAVQGGNPMAGQPDGILYKGSPADCAQPPAVEIQPVSTSLQADTRLQVRIAGCQSGLPRPRVECSLSPGGRTVRFEGWTHDVRMDLPEVTGSSDFSLSCSADGQSMGSFSASLYLTLKATRPMLLPPISRPPLAEWYELAVSWGGGFRLRDGEDPVLQALLSGVYGYGQENWRYGFCKEGKDGSCTFGKTKIPSKALRCGNPGFCRCYWFQILPGGQPQGCNFSTCFGFSEVFEVMSALMGIGGLKEHVEVGKFGNGFVLHPIARANDPALPGFLHTGYRDLLCRYFFLNHDLRLRNRLYYDATFGRIYTRLDELVHQSVVSASANVEFEEGAACFRDVGYGEWLYYDLVEAVGACFGGPVPPTDPRSPALGIPPPGATFVPGGVEAAWIGREIEVAALMNVKDPGTYVYDVRLAKAGKTITYYNRSVRLERGPQEAVRFRFPMDEEVLDPGGLTVTLVLYAVEPLRHLDDAEVAVRELLR